jgi:hypothetical protein
MTTQVIYFAARSSLLSFTFGAILVPSHPMTDPSIRLQRPIFTPLSL